jgi:hypothetical protein
MGAYPQTLAAANPDWCASEAGYQDASFTVAWSAEGRDPHHPIPAALRLAAAGCRKMTGASEQ